MVISHILDVTISYNESFIKVNLLPFMLRDE